MNELNMTHIAAVNCITAATDALVDFGADEDEAQHYMADVVMTSVAAGRLEEAHNGFYAMADFLEGAVQPGADSAKVLTLAGTFLAGWFAALNYATDPDEGEDPIELAEAIVSSLVAPTEAAQV